MNTNKTSKYSLYFKRRKVENNDNNENKNIEIDNIEIEDEFNILNIMLRASDFDFDELTEETYNEYVKQDQEEIIQQGGRELNDEEVYEKYKNYIEAFESSNISLDDFSFIRGFEIFVENEYNDDGDDEDIDEDFDSYND